MQPYVAQYILIFLIWFYSSRLFDSAKALAFIDVPTREEVSITIFYAVQTLPEQSFKIVKLILGLS